MILDLDEKPKAIQPPILDPCRKKVIEIGMEVTPEQLMVVEDFLRTRYIAFYVEPPNRFVSLEGLECQCEGK